MITCRILPTGNLLVTASNAARQQIAHDLSLGWSYWSILCEAFEQYACNGSFTVFDAGNANPCIGLTCAPCVAESMTISDEGHNEIDGRLWWFPDYMIRDPLEELKNKGRTVFQLAA